DVYKRQAASLGVSVWGITKGLCGEPKVARAMLDGGCSALGDSRLSNVEKMRAAGIEGPFFLIRIPMLSELDRMIHLTEGCLISSLEALEVLEGCCALERKPFRVVLMFDLGDLREGFLVEDAPKVGDFCASLSWVKVEGVGTNLGCFGGVLATRDNQLELLEVARVIRERSGFDVPLVSGGGTLALKLLEDGSLPAGVNNLRIGEGIILGTDSTGMRDIPYLRRDAVKLIAEVVELRRKPSVPRGEVGRDAFGNVPVFEDVGERLRAILAVGRQDTRPEGLTPLDAGVRILGASSDHMVCDVEDAAGVSMGSRLAFRPNYGAMLQGATSEYVVKQYLCFEGVS
ncbi:MAG: alanine racemase, partial [Thermanaerothrix sp.]|nr:alanine racemase [Thermanaerothrix sp.]